MNVQQLRQPPLKRESEIAIFVELKTLFDLGNP